MADRIEKVEKSYDIYDAYRDVCLTATILLQKITFSESNMIHSFKNFKTDFSYLFNLTSAHPDIDMDIAESKNLIYRIDGWMNENFTGMTDEARKKYISTGLVCFQEYKKLLIQKQVIVFD
jgi:hypothetical protein